MRALAWDAWEAGDVALGFDPGSFALGWAALRVGAQGRPTLLDAGVLRATKSHPLPIRLQALARGLVELRQHLAPCLVGIETPFVNPNQPGSSRTAMVLGMVHGLPLATFGPGAWVEQVPPAEAKRVAGLHGAATKDVVAGRLWSLHGMEVEHLEADATDAIAVGLAALARLQPSP